MPGISEFFCGSQVVYQTESKTAWLGIEVSGLADPDRGPVSPWASEQLALAMLTHTPRATVAAAVTGHLGPGAPPDLDGAVYLAIRFRSGMSGDLGIRLTAPPPNGSEDWENRTTRQQEAATRFLDWIAQQLP